MTQLRNHLAYATCAMCAVFIVASPASAQPVGDPVMRHDYFAASGLSDIATNLNGGNRDGVIGQGGNLATLVAPGGGNPGYVDLPGASDPDVASSYVTFPTRNDPNDGNTGLSNLANTAPNPGSLSIEIWLDFENNNLLNPAGSEELSRYNIFQAWSFGGSRVQLYFDHRGLGGPGSDAQFVGGTKDSDIINAAYRNGDALRQNVVGLHQWVYVFDADFGFPQNNGTWKIYRDGVEMMGDPLEDSDPNDGMPPTGLQASDLYKQVGIPEGANIFTLAGEPGQLTVGGEGSFGQDVFGTSPKSKMYRTLLYDVALDANQVMTNFTDGCSGIGPIGVCDPNFVLENADFDTSNLVDGADFLIWQRGVGGVGTPSTGDANEDTLVNNDDLTIWEDQYGSTPPTVAASVGTVPEPSSALILALGLAGLLLTRQSSSLRRRLPLFSRP